MDVTEQKSAARKTALSARKLAFAKDGGAPRSAAAHFLEVVDLHRDVVVGGYRPIHTELDPTPLMRFLHTLGLTLGVPVIMGQGQPLEFYRWTPGMPMEDGEFGAMIPKIKDVVEPQLLIAPLVAWDRHGYRLGYGGGFYDRTLERLRQRRPTKAIGYAYAAQELPGVPREVTDQPLNGIATNEGAHLFTTFMGLHPSNRPRP